MVEDDGTRFVPGGEVRIACLSAEHGATAKNRSFETPAPVRRNAATGGYAVGGIAASGDVTGDWCD
jgi:hypothetical protein